ncbi:MAG: hypothetical protein ABFD07_16955 [Methanobacterium sp.]
MPRKKATKRKIDVQWIVMFILAVIGEAAAVFVVPEVRQALHLDSENSIANQAATLPTNTSISDTFPCFLGSEWDYQTSQVTEGKTADNKTNTETITGYYSQTVTSIFTGLSDKVKIVEFTIDGSNYKNECNMELTSGKTSIWYILDSSHLYVSCSKNEANEIASVIIHPDNGDTLPLPEYVFPLSVGTKWAEFNEEDVKNQSNDYVWYVESIIPVDVPAGKYQNCYRILLRTNPDTTIKYVCSNVGLVSYLYSHNGSVDDYSVELTKYKIP